jgi:hypothetical protein
MKASINCLPYIFFIFHKLIYIEGTCLNPYRKLLAIYFLHISQTNIHREYMLKSISQGIDQPEWPRGLICHAIWILACIILLIISYKAKIAAIFWSDILCHCDVIDMHFLHAGWNFCTAWRYRSLWRRPCKFFIITTKYMINSYILFTITKII